MLLNKKNKFFKISLRNLFNQFDYCFFIFNLIDMLLLSNLYKIFGFGNVFHISYFKNFYFFNLSGLLSGNNFICFFSKSDLFSKFFILNSLLSDKLLLVSICLNKIFINCSIKIDNLFNVMFTNFIIYVYIFLVNIYLFFFKFLFIFNVKNKKC